MLALCPYPFWLVVFFGTRQGHRRVQDRHKGLRNCEVFLRGMVPAERAIPEPAELATPRLHHLVELYVRLAVKRPADAGSFCRAWASQSCSGRWGL